MWPSARENDIRIAFYNTQSIKSYLCVNPVTILSMILTWLTETMVMIKNFYFTRDFRRWISRHTKFRFTSIVFGKVITHVILFLHLLGIALWSLKILFSDPENQPSPINSS